MDFVTSQGDLLYLKTNVQAENFHLITSNTKTKEIKDIISEDKNDLLEDITLLYLYEMETERQFRKFDLPSRNLQTNHINEDR
ncbi:unnamed protein product [Rotaria sp. Silwood2]|nr:unnamed protein product [Rotaria sp. Silwood2]CAF4749897.1 unnamed protein product [Rotaria sp. Silwood2]